MAADQPELTVVLSDAASAELDRIWLYNVERYGVGRAENYDAFLRSRIYALATEHDMGRPVEGRPGLRKITIRRRSKDQRHIAVYRVTPVTVNVLRVFHTAQDVHGRIEDEID